jgi:N-acetylmuramic acid 6-phosphate etherase
MNGYKELIEQLSRLDTELVNPDTMDLDRLGPLEIVRKINEEDKKVASVVEKSLPQIARTAELVAATIRSGGRIFYVGAGTSGRLGVLDAAECPPTFGIDPEKISGVISGGYATLVLSIEGAEDNRQAAVDDLKERDLCSGDMVIGLAASTRTPYTLAALEYAISLGCYTAFIVCNQNSEITVSPEITIALPVGPEVITGSTRMKSGTAQKMTLNMISTTAMVLLGKTLGNRMIDLQSRSEKLAARSRKILIDLLEISLTQADDLLKQSGGSVKTALVMHRWHCTKAEAEDKLRKAEGFVSRINDST